MSILRFLAWAGAVIGVAVLGVLVIGVAIAGVRAALRDDQ